MTPVVLDTNVVLRLYELEAPENPLVKQAIASLLARGDALFVTPQIILELWVAATRPLESNGFGWTAELTTSVVRGLLDQFDLLEEGPGLLTKWLELVGSMNVRGKRAYDVRIAAVMLDNGVGHVLTLNTADFSGINGIVALHPSAFAAP